MHHPAAAAIVAALAACPVWAPAAAAAPAAIAIKVDDADPVRASFARMLQHEPTRHAVPPPAGPRDPLVDALVRPLRGSAPVTLATSTPAAMAGNPGRGGRQP